MLLIYWLEPIITSVNKIQNSGEHPIRTGGTVSRSAVFQDIFVFIFHPIQNIPDYTYIRSG
jgi:hypothetical protein